MADPSQRPLIGAIVVVVILIVVLLYRANAARHVAPIPPPPDSCAAVDVPVASGEGIACGNGGPFPDSKFARYSYQPDATLDPMSATATCVTAPDCSASGNSLGYWECLNGQCYPSRALAPVFGGPGLAAADKYTTDVSEATCVSACTGGAVPGCKAYVYRDPGPPTCAGGKCTSSGSCDYYGAAPTSIGVSDAASLPVYVGVLT